MLSDNRTNIIIVTYHGGSCEPMLEKEAECIKSNLDKNNLPFLLTVHDNTILNENLSDVWNSLILHSPTDCVVLLNSDTVVVQSSWLEKMRETLYSDPTIAAVSPSTNGCENQQKINSVLDVPLERTEIDFGKNYPGWQLEGFCLMLSVERFKKIGLFSNQYSFYGQETAWLKKAQQMGYKTMWRKDAFVFHYGKATAKLAEKDGFNIQANLKKAQELYQAGVM